MMGGGDSGGGEVQWGGIAPFLSIYPTHSLRPGSLLLKQMGRKWEVNKGKGSFACCECCGTCCLGQRVTAISLAFRKGLLTGRNPNLPDLKAVQSALCLVARQNQSARLQEIQNKRVMGSLGLGVVRCTGSISVEARCPIWLELGAVPRPKTSYAETPKCRREP